MTGVDILERLYRGIATKGKFDRDQELLRQAAEEIRTLRMALSRQRGDTIALMVGHERHKAEP